MIPPHGDMVLSSVSRWASPNLDILGVKFDSRLTFKTMCAVLSLVSLKKLVFWSWCSVSLWTSLCCFVATMHWFWQSLNIVLLSGGCCGMSSSASRAVGIFGGQACSYLIFLLLCLCMLYKVCCTKYVILRMSYKVNSNSYHSLFIEFSSASFRVRHNRAAAAAHSLEFQVQRCRTSQFARSFLPTQTRVWNDLPYTVLDIRTLDVFKGTVNHWLPPSVCFSVFLGTGAGEVVKVVFWQFCFSYLGMSCWFY